MRAWLLEQPQRPLVLKEIPKPIPKEGELLVKVRASGVCRTDLHIQEGDLKKPKLPLILGHEIVGIVEETGSPADSFLKGKRVGIFWFAGSCKACPYCQEGKENLCDSGLFTGYSVDGGFAEYAICKTKSAILIPPQLSDVDAAPLLCAGVIGYRAYQKARPKTTLGLYGFGAAAHIIAQVAVHEGKEVYAFTRPGDRKTQEFARKLGAIWAGDSTARAPKPLDAAIIFAPVGSLVPLALQSLEKGGRLILAGIHMSEIPAFAYEDLFWEKSIASVANVTLSDAQAFFALMAQNPIAPEVTLYPFEKAGQALEDLRQGKFQGAAVLQL